MWVKEGDKNTKFFKLRTLKRRAFNKLCMLEKEDKIFTKNEDGIKDMVVSFYKNLLTKSMEEDQNMTNELLENIPQLLGEEDNQKLIEPFIEEEIIDTIFMMDKDKTSRPNKFLAQFFQHFWSSIGDDIIKVVKEL